ncbi:hypothetical protein GVN24_02320 [Rhizobium sp. CRIBSB]|nr:hypothetical protein [Rhizobium sp. CRIBSB]
MVPQTARLPCIVTSMISERQNSRLEDAAGQYEARVRVAVHHSSPAALMDLSEGIKELLIATIQTEVEGGGALVNIFKDTTDITDFSEDRTTFRRLMDFKVQWWVMS